ncbi:MAG: response regulator, partial [Acidobacteria bacterium]|nr:response regulator [Acidobacteriota bacterium]
PLEKPQLAKGQGTILIVDDEPLIRECLQKFAQSFGYEAETAEHGRMALDMLHKNSYDLIAMDVSMPELDGIKTLKAIKQNRPEQKVLMISGNAPSPELEPFLNDGSVLYQKKPMNKATFNLRLQELQGFSTVSE